VLPPSTYTIYLRVQLAQLLVCQHSLPGRDAPSRQEVAQVLVEDVQRVHVAEGLELFLHPVSRNVLLHLLDEPGRQATRVANESSLFPFIFFSVLFFSKNTKNDMEGIAHASSTWLCTWYSLGHDDQLDVSYCSLKQIWGPLVETCRE